MKRKVVDWRDSRSEIPRAADMGIQVLCALPEFGCVRELVTINVAKGIPQLYRGGNRAKIVWAEIDLEPSQMNFRRSRQDTHGSVASPLLDVARFERHGLHGRMLLAQSRVHLAIYVHQRSIRSVQ